MSFVICVVTAIILAPRVQKNQNLRKVKIPNLILRIKIDPELDTKNFEMKLENVNLHVNFT